MTKQVKRKPNRMFVEKLVEVEKRREESFWFPDFNEVAKVTDTKTGLVASIYSSGEIRVTFDDDSGDTFDNEEAIKEAKNLRLFDKDIRSLNFIYNNWFEVEVYRPSEIKYAGYPGECIQLASECDVTYTISDAIHSAKSILKELD